MKAALILAFFLAGCSEPQDSAETVAAIQRCRTLGMAAHVFLGRTETAVKCEPVLTVRRMILNNPCVTPSRRYYSVINNRSRHEPDEHS